MDEAVREREPFHWRTAISYKTKDRIVVRGYDLNDLVGNLSFTAMAYLVWRGGLPSAAHGRAPALPPVRPGGALVAPTGAPLQVGGHGRLNGFGRGRGRDAGHRHAAR